MVKLTGTAIWFMQPKPDGDAEQGDKVTGFFIPLKAFEKFIVPDSDGSDPAGCGFTSTVVCYKNMSLQVDDDYVRSLGSSGFSNLVLGGIPSDVVTHSLTTSLKSSRLSGYGAQHRAGRVCGAEQIGEGQVPVCKARVPVSGTKGGDGPGPGAGMQARASPAALLGVSGVDEVGQVNARGSEDADEGECVERARDVGEVSRGYDLTRHLVLLGHTRTMSGSGEMPVCEYAERGRVNSSGEVNEAPLLFKFSEAYEEKWRDVIGKCEMDKPPKKKNEWDGRRPRAVPLVHGTSVIAPAPWSHHRYTGTGPLISFDSQVVHYSPFWWEDRRFGEGRSVLKISAFKLLTEWLLEASWRQDDIAPGPLTLTLIDARLMTLMAQRDTSLLKWRIARLKGVVKKDRLDVFASRGARRNSWPLCDNVCTPIAGPLVTSLFSKQPHRQVPPTPSSHDPLTGLTGVTNQEVRDLALRKRRASEVVGGLSRESLHHLGKEGVRRECRRADPCLGFEGLFRIVEAHDITYADGSRYTGAIDSSGFPHTREGEMGLLETAAGQTYPFRYSGGWRHGVPHGGGELRTGRFRYKGSLKNGVRHGRGVSMLLFPPKTSAFFPDELAAAQASVLSEISESDERVAAVVKGVYNEDRVDGDVVIEIKSDKLLLQRYEGTIERGIGSGSGTLYFRNGNVYKGEISAGQRYGDGVFIRADGKTLYDGEWAEDKPHGEAKRVMMEDGGVYEGEMEDGVKSGHGHLKKSDGTDHYVGYWLKDQPNGRGHRVYTDGFYEGEFRLGQRWGNGTFTYRDGRQYTGTWKHDKQEGEGELLDERRERGRYRFTKGEIIEESYREYGKTKTLPRSTAVELGKDLCPTPTPMGHFLQYEVVDEVDRGYRAWDEFNNCLSTFVRHDTPTAISPPSTTQRTQRDPFSAHLFKM
eukprot:GHVN01083521.1.p1 GENE.GHVN01083521.1~~GHVN01083521.1.p1  ORF type:complete len:981 (-),score=225.50 GHVN01083521.1:147-2915(-)